MELRKLREQFTQAFGTDNGETLRFFHAPGRVNLIGEHTDYNGGNVFPCALSLGTYGAARRIDAPVIRLVSGNNPLRVEIPLSTIAYRASDDWANYPKAVVDQLQKQGCKVGGFALYLYGDLPNGAGLSSSASIELLTAVAVNTMFDCGLDTPALAMLSQRAENQFVGVNCGIMDQFASAMGKKNHAILLNCAKMDYEYVPLQTDGYTIVIANTNKQRGLADSKYNERRSECEQAVVLLQKVCDISCLADLTPAAFQAHAHIITDDILLKRATHVVEENARTLIAVDALNRNDLPAFGRLMNASHVSLRDLYAVTGPELDALAEAAWNAEGVLGSRMTGAGFGGCTVSIVRTDAVPRFIDTVGTAYQARTGLTATFYSAETGDGAREVL